MYVYFTAAFAHLTFIAPHQLHTTTGLALKVQLSRWPAPAQASTCSSPRSFSANTQAQLSIVALVVLCRWTHL